MKIRLILYCALTFFLLISSHSVAGCFDFLSKVGWGGRPASGVVATQKFYPWLHFEFGEGDIPDKIVMLDKKGWGRKQRTVLYQGKLTRIPVLRKQKVPEAVAQRVTSYRHIPNYDASESTLTVTADDGVFVMAHLAPASGFGYFNYLGKPTITTFFIPQLKPWKYVSSAWIRGLGGYEGKDEDRTQYDTPYVLIALSEGEHDGGLTGDALYNKLSYLRKSPKGGYETEIPFERVETWLVKALKPPADDFSNAGFYRFGGPSLRVGNGDYTHSKPAFRGTKLTLFPRNASEAISISDPKQRDPKTMDLTTLE